MRLSRKTLFIILSALLLLAVPASLAYFYTGAVPASHEAPLESEPPEPRRPLRQRPQNKPAPPKDLLTDQPHDAVRFDGEGKPFLPMPWSPDA